MIRICKNCNTEKSIEEFYKHSCGYRHVCKSCTKEHSYLWAKDNKERRLEIVRKSRSNPNNAWKEYRNKYRKETGEVAKRRASKLNRTPLWLSEDDLWFIKEIYSLRKLREEMTGVKWHVDHIVPLNGKNVSGLHVHWNLQLLTASENIRKGSNFNG